MTLVTRREILVEHNRYRNLTAYGYDNQYSASNMRLIFYDYELEKLA